MEAFFISTTMPKQLFEGIYSKVHGLAKKVLDSTISPMV